LQHNPSVLLHYTPLKTPIKAFLSSAAKLYNPVLQHYWVFCFTVSFFSAK
jgi:hypothetical protein